MEAIYTSIALVLVAIVSGLVTWRVSIRTKSGKIDTSEAATLWDEGASIRHDLMSQVLLLRGQLSDAIQAISNLNHEIQLSRAETETARLETRISREETRKLMLQIEEVHNEVKTRNTLTIGGLADNAETRRILDIPERDRTPVEKEHIASADERLPKSQRPEVPNE